MKVLLVNPLPIAGPKVIREGRCEQRFSSFQYVMVPISLPQIGAVLLADHFEVKIFDFMVEEADFSQSVAIVAKEKPDLVIINFSTLTYSGDKEFARQIKEKLPEAHLSAIGVHVTALSERTLKETELDSVIRGEPELTALALAKALKNKKDLNRVLGLSFKTGRQIQHNPDRPPIEDLDQLPFAARELLRNERYFAPVHNRPYTLVITARGCPNKCTFCTARLYYGDKFRVRRPQKVVAEIDEAVNRFKIKDFMMWADTFTLDKKFVMEFCRLIQKKHLKIEWLCNGRVNSVDLEMLLAMKAAGCKGIAYGVESGVQKILNNVKKGTTLAQIENAFALTRQAGLESLAHVIFGLPGETKETIKETCRFINKIDPDYAQFYAAVPFAGTEFYRQAQKFGWIATDNWDQYEINQAVIATPKLAQQDLAKARRQAIFRFYLRKTFILRQLRQAKSPKELFNLIRKGLSFLKNWG